MEGEETKVEVQKSGQFLNSFLFNMGHESTPCNPPPPLRDPLTPPK